MNGFQRRKEKKMNSILQTALQLFAYRGLKAVSIAEIAKKAEVSQVSIYNYFDSKENLAKQAIFTYMNEKMEDGEMLLDSQLSFREKLEKLLLSSDEDASNYSQEFFQSEIWKDPVIQNFLNEYYQNRTLPFIMSLIEQGKKEGSVNCDLLNESILLYIESFKNMLTQTDISKKARLQLGSLLFYGLQGKPSRND